ncbi:hypothetical protein G3A_18810 [Bacillus sp. 17376]|uniref:Phospholipase C/D domain-containing protein n=2 Tax=Mesobacillus boroniphilus TaxID=308892 RepID=W4RVK1_9BACI|nr:hypothetical protein G3A_18810 [Bacillus sp. 17376]GAE48331.1 hypothetical protein JCM21738_5441 [Mesobacillus boroniphilus JCM 21738]
MKVAADSIAPDAISPKDLSHFYKGEIEDYSRYIDYKEFLHKYNSQAECHYILGYYTHLISDNIWLKGFYLSWLRNRMEADDEILALYHHDFNLLNGKLLEYYGFKNELRKVLNTDNIPITIELQEVNSRDLNEIIPYVLDDMEYSEEVINEKLNVFTFNQIVGYIETSVQLGVLMIKNKIS